MLVADTGLSRHRRRSAKACLLVDTQAFSRPGPSGRGRRRARAPRGDVGTATGRTRGRCRGVRGAGPLPGPPPPPRRGRRHVPAASPCLPGRTRGL